MVRLVKLEVNLKCILINRCNFSYRYGDCHPVFFIGSLEAAFQEAFYVKARDVSAIYLFKLNNASHRFTNCAWGNANIFRFFRLKTIWLGPFPQTNHHQDAYFSQRAEHDRVLLALAEDSVELWNRFLSFFLLFKGRKE